MTTTTDVPAGEIRPVLKKGSCERCGGQGRAIDDRRTGQVLAGRRMAAGLRQSDVAKKMRISGSYISELESGTRAWTVALIARYERALFV